MKKVFLIIVFLVAVNAFAQNPICVTVNDTPCDANWSTNSATNTNGNELEGLYIYYDTGILTNQVHWQIYLDTALIYEDSACGCGSQFHETFFTDAQHELKVKIKTTGCQTTNCSSIPATLVKVFTPKESACFQECD